MIDINVNTTPAAISGSIRKIGETSDGKIIYESDDPKTGGKKFTIPKENQDKFERNLSELDNMFESSPQNYAKVAQQSHLATITGAILGGALTAALIKTPSKMGKFWKTTAGAIGGMLLGAITYTAVKINHIAKIGKKVKELGIQDYKEEVPKADVAEKATEDKAVK